MTDNTLTSCASGPILDNGINTILNTVRLCLIKELGTAAWVVTTAAAMGIDVDAADEGAVGKIKLPTDLQQVVRIKVWATSGVAEADGMRGTVTASGGIDNEAWNAEAIAVTKTSATLNFAAGDIINWMIDPSDYADIGHLTASDVLQFCFYYAIADGVNCATDALIMGDCVEIHYV